MDDVRRFFEQDLLRLLSKAGQAYLKHFPVWLGAGVVTFLVTGFSLLILGGLVQTAYFMMWVRALRDGKAPQFSDLLEYKDKFLPLTLTFLAVAAIVGLGFLALVIPGILAAALLLWTMPLMIEYKRDSVLDALTDSKNLVMDKGESGGPVRHVLLVLTAMALSLLASSLGGLIPWFGWVLPMLAAPLTTGFLAAAYVDIMEDAEEDMLESVD